MGEKNTESLPGSYAGIAFSPSDVDRLYKYYQGHKEKVFCIVAKETARNGALSYPAVLKIQRKGEIAFYVCPDYGKIQEMKVLDDTTSLKVPADQFFFRWENSQNHKCQYYRTPLWSALNPDNFKGRGFPWVRIGGYRYIDRENSISHVAKTTNKEIRKNCWKLRKTLTVITHRLEATTIILCPAISEKN